MFFLILLLVPVCYNVQDEAANHRRHIVVIVSKNPPKKKAKVTRALKTVISFQFFCFLFLFLPYALTGIVVHTAHNLLPSLHLFFFSSVSNYIFFFLQSYLEQSRETPGGKEPLKRKGKRLLDDSCDCVPCTLMTLIKKWKHTKKRAAPVFTSYYKTYCCCCCCRVHI